MAKPPKFSTLLNKALKDVRASYWGLDNYEVKRVRARPHRNERVYDIEATIAGDEIPSRELSGEWFRTFIQAAKGFDLTLRSVYIDQDDELVYTFTGTYTK